MKGAVPAIFELSDNRVADTFAAHAARVAGAVIVAAATADAEITGGATVDPGSRRVVLRVERGWELRHGRRRRALAPFELTGDALDAHNTVEAPNRVQPAAFTGAIVAVHLTPSCSPSP